MSKTDPRQAWAASPNSASSAPPGPIRSASLLLALASLVAVVSLAGFPFATPADASTLWGSSVPSVVDSGDPTSLELGVRFQSDTAGYVTGIRFYKAPTNTGTHVGHLWNNSGTLLATAVFSGESSSGWQQVSFTTPVSIAANTTYVASYVDPTGHFSLNRPYFTSTYNSSPLHALASTSGQPNGIYHYPATGFPASTYQQSNYWVDVVFSVTASGSGSTPTVASISPATGSTSGGTAVTINGTNFQSGATVSFGGANSTAVTFISAVRINALTPAGSAGTVSVTVSNPGGLSASLSSAFTYTTTSGSGGGSGGGTSTGSIWHPALNTSWQWQLTTPVDQTVAAQMYDIDGFDNSASVVTSLHNQGRKVLCYIDLGTWENWRPDANVFPAAVLGQGNGWPGEKWLDIRRIDILGPIIQSRLDLCRSKGFDGIEPDNIDGYSNNTGFPLTYQDQINYNTYIANAAHARNLSVGLKNDVDQVNDLVSYFDFAVNEQCFQYQECDTLVPFISAGKAVFEVEYSLSTGSFCPQANSMNFNAMQKHLSLDAWRSPCR